MERAWHDFGPAHGRQRNHLDHVVEYEYQHFIMSHILQCLGRLEPLRAPAYKTLEPQHVILDRITRPFRRDSWSARSKPDKI